MPKGKVILPQVLRNLAQNAFAGRSYSALAREHRISRTTIGRIMSKLRGQHVFSARDLESLSDGELFKIMYPTGTFIEDGDNGSFVEFTRSGSVMILRPDFNVLAAKIIDEKKSALTLFIDYQDECLRLNKKPYTRSTFYRHLKRAVDEIQRGSNAIMSLDYEYGDVCMLDAAGTTAMLTMEDGTRVKMIVLAICWAASGYVYATFIEHMSTIEVCRSIGRALKFFGCKPATLKIDNAKCMVVRHEKGKEAVLNPTFEEYVRQYEIDVDANNPYSPTSKSQIEYSVRLITERVIRQLDCSIPRTKSEWDRLLQEAIDKYINNVSFKGGAMSRRDRFFEYEKGRASPLLQIVNEIATVMDVKVTRSYHVKIGDHAYSVPFTCIGLRVRVKFTDLQVKIYCDGELVARHQRKFNPGRTTDPKHMPDHHRAYLESKRRFKTDDDLLRYAQTVSEPVYQYCIWRLQKMDGQRFKACTGLINYVLNTDRAVADEAMRQMMREPPERRSFYTLRAIYKELMGYKNSHDGFLPVQSELNFDAALPSHKEHYPWNDDGDEAFISNGAWFDDLNRDGAEDDDDEEEKKNKAKAKSAGQNSEQDKGADDHSAGTDTKGGTK